MNNDNITIEDWKEEADDVGGLSTAWAAEWFGPEEKIEDPEELAKVGVHVIYKNEKHFTWFFPQVKSVLLDNKVREFIEYNGITDATDDDVQELKDFFFHFIRFVTFEVDPEADGHKTFEPENVAEALGDEDLEDIEDELEDAGMDQFGDDKPTLH